jgi:hypothetical protein
VYILLLDQDDRGIATPNASQGGVALRQRSGGARRKLSAVTREEKPMRQIGKVVVVLAAFVAALSVGACRAHRMAPASSLEAARRSYRATADLGRLQSLMAGLRLGMPERDVVALFGEPSYCPIEGQCYYPSDKRDQQGFIITLVVEYRRNSHREHDVDMVITHRLESYSLFGVGE